MEVSTGFALAAGACLAAITFDADGGFAAGCLWMAFANWMFYVPRAAQSAGEKP